jgi:hypothetical protein
MSLKMIKLNQLFDDSADAESGTHLCNSAGCGTSHLSDSDGTINVRPY